MITFPCGALGQVWCFIVLIFYLCFLFFIISILAVECPLAFCVSFSLCCGLTCDFGISWSYSLAFKRSHNKGFSNQTDTNKSGCKSVTLSGYILYLCH